MARTPLGAVRYASTLSLPPHPPQANTSSAKLLRSSPAQVSRGVRSFFVSAFAAASGGALASCSFRSASAMGSFARLAADYLVGNMNLSGPVCLVPIPSSDAVVNTPFTRFPARDLANALVAELRRKRVTTVTVDDILRFREARTASHEGGSRDADELYQNLTVVAGPSMVATYVLVDDVCTSGAHMRAAKRRLEEAGAHVALGVAAGRTVHVPPDNPLAPRTEDFDDLEDPPEIDWEF